MAIVEITRIVAPIVALSALAACAESVAPMDAATGDTVSSTLDVADAGADATTLDGTSPACVGPWQRDANGRCVCGDIQDGRPALACSPGQYCCLATIINGEESILEFSCSATDVGGSGSTCRRP